MPRRNPRRHERHTPLNLARLRYELDRLGPAPRYTRPTYYPQHPTTGDDR